MQLKISTIVVSAFDQNCRVLSREGYNEIVVVDPGADLKRIQAAVNGEVTQIWLTHSHIDHCGVVAPLKEQSGAPLYAHPIEKSFRGKIEELSHVYGIAPGYFNCPEPDVAIAGGEVLNALGSEFKVLFTPGHSPGHLCFYCAEASILLAGDAVFAGSIGRTDLPGGDHKTLITSIQREILTLPNEIKILSGHGPDSTVGRERISNPFLR